MRLHQLELRMIRALTILFTLVCCQYSYACSTLAEFKFKDIVLASTVFVGDLVKYEVVKPKQKLDLSAYAILSFTVSEYLAGELREKNLKVYWHNSTIGVPMKLENTRYLVAVTSNKQPPLRGVSATIFKSHRPNLIRVLQAPCAFGFLLAPNKENLERAKKLLKKIATAYSRK